MMASVNTRTAAPVRPGQASKLAPVVQRSVTCKAATAWTAWDTYMDKRGAAADAGTKEAKSASDIAGFISKSAQGYKSKFSVHQEPAGASFKLQHVDKIQVKDLPKDLHDRMEAIGCAALKTALNLEGELDYLNASFTTTDIDAALSVTGTQIQQGRDKNAVLAFVVCETERQVSWSRLEGLILHWACGTAAGGPWSMPPDGWSASPKKARDAGGAWQCQFEKQNVGDNQSMYVLVMQLPLKGILKSGGIVFVLKGTENKADRWLKDASTEKDFFLSPAQLPTTKM